MRHFLPPRLLELSIVSSSRMLTSIVGGGLDMLPCFSCKNLDCNLHDFQSSGKDHFSAVVQLFFFLVLYSALLLHNKQHLSVADAFSL